MLVPFIIFLMILSPVLIPTAVTIVNVMQGNHRPAPPATHGAWRLAASPFRPPPDICPPSRAAPEGVARLVYGTIGLQNRRVVPAAA